MTGQGIGARLARKEDERYLRGRGQFVGDMSLPHLRDVAFLRSPRAHARIKGIRIPDSIRERVFIAAAIHARYVGRPDAPWLSPAIKLLTPSERRRAQILGRAILLAYRFSGGVPAVLE